MGYPKELGPDPEPTTSEHMQKLRQNFGALARAALERTHIQKPSELHFDFGHYLAPTDFLVDYERYSRTARIPEQYITPTDESPLIITAQELSGDSGNKLYIVGHKNAETNQTRYYRMQRTVSPFDELSVQELAVRESTPFEKDSEGTVQMFSGVELYRLHRLVRDGNYEAVPGYEDGESPESDPHVQQVFIELGWLMDAVFMWEHKAT